MRVRFGLEKVRPGATVCPEKTDASQAFGSSPSSDPEPVPGSNRCRGEEAEPLTAISKKQQAHTLKAEVKH